MLIPKDSPILPYLKRQRLLLERRDMFFTPLIFRITCHFQTRNFIDFPKLIQRSIKISGRPQTLSINFAGLQSIFQQSDYKQVCFVQFCSKFYNRLTVIQRKAIHLLKCEALREPIFSIFQVILRSIQFSANLLWMSFYVTTVILERNACQIWRFILPVTLRHLFSTSSRIQYWPG